MQIRDDKPRSTRPATTQPKTEKPAPKPAPKSSPAPAKSNPPKAKDQFDPKPAPKPANYVPDRAVQGFRSSSKAEEIQTYAQSQKANVTTNKDGSVTRSSEHDTKGAHHTQELTTSKGQLLESHLKYTETSAPKTGEKITNTFTSDTDAAGRTRWTHDRLRERTRQDGAQVTESHAETKDHWGIKKDTDTTTVVTDKKGTKTTAIETDQHDNRGNKLHAEDTTKVTTNGNKTVTTNKKTSDGSELTTNNSAKLEGGKFTMTDGADWKSGSSTFKSKYTETTLKPSTATPDKSLGPAKKDKLGVVQSGGNLLGAAGLKQEWKGEFNNIKEVNTSKDPNSFVGSRVGTSGSQSVSIGADGVNGSFNRTAQAGVYAETKGSTTGKYGSANYSAQAKAEAIATVDAKGKLDTNGLDASINAKVGVSAEASVTGHAETKSVKVAGVDVKASVDGTAKVSAEAKAEATGNVKVTRHPPTAIAEGTVGASAVVKIEGEVKASAGPFSVKASAYASAGAEAKATGVIGYSDGKIKIGGSAGAALGLGAGGSATVEIDVKQIGDMAKNTADVNHDGKLGLDDAKAAASAVVNKAGDVANQAKNKVLGWLGFGG